MDWFPGPALPTSWGSTVVKKKPVRSSTARSRLPSPAPGPWGPDLRRAQCLLMQLLAIPGRSGQEGPVAQFIQQQLRQAGAPASAIRFDHAHRQSRHGGSVGNMVFRLSGTLRAPRRLLMAHMDTVPLCEGAKPVVRGSRVVPADKNTALGADDRAGVAVVLTAALEILRRNLPHPPLTFLFSVQEELGLFGARHAQLNLLGQPALAFNFDGGSPEKITVGATGGYRLDIRVRGRAAHAGNAPQHGVSAIAIAALAIARLQQQGWHGLIERNGRQGTSNVGVIRGGDATNVVTPLAEVRAEARSHDPAFRQQIIDAIHRAFQTAAQEVKNAEGQHGEVEIDGRLDYESFRLEKDEPCVQAAQAALRSIGSEPLLALTNGGLDANWMTVRGIPTVTLGCGQINPHTTEEQLDLDRFRQACRVGLLLATGREADDLASGDE